MCSTDELKMVIMLTYLTDPMLKKVSKVTSIAKVKAGDFVFRQDDYAENLWAVIKGTVGLEFEKSPTKRYLVTQLAPGMTFGISSMVDMEPKKYILSARAFTDLELFKWRGSDLNALFYEDFEMGYIVMKRLTKILITRLQVKNIQISGGYES